MNNEINAQAKELALEVINEIKKQQTDKRFHNTKLLMKNYTKLKSHIDDVSNKNLDCEVQDPLEEDVELKSVMRTKARTAQMLACVDIALDVLEEEYLESDKYYVFEAFELYYIKGYTYQQLADYYYAGKNTPARWVNEVVRKLSVLLWGIDALGM